MHALAQTAHTARPALARGHAALAEQVVEVLAHQGIASDVVGNDAAAIVRLKDGVGTYGFVCRDLPACGRDDHWTTLEWMRTRAAGWPTELTSGCSRGGYLCETAQGGVVAAFRRPFSLWEVQQTLAEVLPYL